MNERKSIIIIDEPSCCKECFALNDNGDYPICMVTGETKGYTFNINGQKMDRCPLRPVPEFKLSEAPFEVDYMSYSRGFDAAIDKILWD